MLIWLYLMTTLVRSQEVPTPATLLGPRPRDFNYHAYQNQYLEPEPTKNGPVLFPNDAPPQPRPPLVVTSRPIEESIARSELNPEPQNNSIAEQSQINKVQFKPQFLARIKNYRPFVAPVATTSYPYGHHSPYQVANKYQEQGPFSGRQENQYDDYEDQPAPLPPIYKVLSNYANQRVLDHKLKQKTKKAPKRHDDYAQYDNNVNNKDYDDYHNQGHNYAFSYTVRDHKTGDDFSHSQHSSGSATNGEYRVRLPDGRMQVVSYTADENGYKADVRYDDEEKAKENALDTPLAPVNYAINDPVYSERKANNFNNYNDKVYNQREENRDFKPVIEKPIQNDYQYGDSKEYNEDYSLEFGKDYEYQPHRSKFTKFAPQKQRVIFIPRQKHVKNVRPSYPELKPLFVQKPKISAVPSTANYLYSKIPIELSVPSTTPSFEPTTSERVVLIGGKQPLYTNIKPSLISPTATPNSLEFRSSTPASVYSTPSNFLASTITALRQNVDLSGPKPVFSSSFIDRINKYLSFK